MKLPIKKSKGVWKKGKKVKVPDFIVKKYDINEGDIKNVLNDDIQYSHTIEDIIDELKLEHGEDYFLSGAEIKGDKIELEFNQS